VQKKVEEGEEDIQEYQDEEGEEEEEEEQEEEEQEEEDEDEDEDEEEEAVASDSSHFLACSKNLGIFTKPPSEIHSPPWAL
jgi:hypothetical protein